MSKLKNMPGLAWLVIGVLATLLLIPTTAYAAGALKFTGIEGPSTNKADVTPAGQLLTTEDQPSNLVGYQGFISASSSAGYAGIFAAPSTEAVLLDTVSLDVRSFSGSASGTTAYSLFVGASNCNDQVGTWYQEISPTGIGMTEIPLTPGVTVPPGDSLCSYYLTGSATYLVSVTGTGALIPSTDISNTPLRAVPVLTPKNE
jgi:hypothetical protein